MKKLLVRAPATSMSGYGEQARFVLEALMSRPDLYDVYIDDINWGKTGSVVSSTTLMSWINQNILKNKEYVNQAKDNLQYDMSIQITIPNEWRHIAKVNIGHTAGIECDRVTPEWIHFGNHMDKIITISQHSKMVYESSSYKLVNHTKKIEEELSLQTPISYVGYNTRCTEPSNNFELEVETSFNFLSVSQMGPRKNTKNLIEWFISEFHDDSDVGLILKTHIKNCSYMDSIETESQIESILSAYPDKKCKVYLIHGEMSSEEMCSLYQHPKIKSYVTFTHGEGFGLPIFEAACNGLPVIAPNWSGHIDFLYAKEKKKGKESIKPLFCKVPFTLKPVQKDALFPGLISEDSRWCYVEALDAKKSMRKVNKNYSMYLSWAKKLQKELLVKFTKENQHKQLIDELSIDTNQAFANEVVVL